VTVIGNGVPAEIFGLHALRKRSNGPIVFASVLNYWTGRKNGRRLVKAFIKVRERFGSGVQLWLFGFDYGPGGPASEWARAHGADSGIRFCGTVAHPDLLQILAEQVDILVHPSLEEAHSMAVIEAMAMGLPVIGGELSGGMSWTLAHGRAGMLVDVRSPDAIAQGMQTLVTDPELRNALATEGRKLALSEYCIDQTVDRYLSCLTAATLA